LLYLAVLLLYALTRGCGGLLGWNLARAYRQIVEPEDQPRKYSPTCRLPTEVMYRILYHSLESIRNSGGADVQSRAKACMILSVTTRQWDWLAEREKRRWPMFSLEVRRGYKLPGLDSIRRRYHEKLGEALEERCQHCGLGGLAISLNDYSRMREEAVEEWTHILTWLIRGFKSAQQLQLLLQDGSESAAMAVDAALPGFPGVFSFASRSRGTFELLTLAFLQTSRNSSSSDQAGYSEDASVSRELTRPPVFVVSISNSSISSAGLHHFRQFRFSLSTRSRSTPRRTPISARTSSLPYLVSNR